MNALLDSTMEMKEKGVDNLGFKNSQQTLPDETSRAASEKDVTVNVPAGDVGPSTHEDDVQEYDETGDIILKKKILDKNANPCARAIGRLQELLLDSYYTHEVLIWQLIGVIFLLAYLAYVIYAMVCSKVEGEGAIRLLVCTIFGLFIFVLHLTRRSTQHVTEGFNKLFTSQDNFKFRRGIRWALYVISTIATVTLIIVLVAVDTPRNLLSLAGLAAFIVICFLTSYSPALVDWHPVFWGFSLQFYFAVIILKTRWGYETFKWLGDRVTEFLAYSDEGAKFVFGDFAGVVLADGSQYTIKEAYKIHLFAFQIMPVVTFFSTIIAILYYLGVMQKIVTVLGRFLSFCLGTTPAESLNAAGNIFVAMTESPLMIKPFLSKMTSSELHAIMTGGFATIAGSVLGVYISFGVPSNHLLSASVMSAPAALAISKLTYPEVEEPIVRPGDYDKIERPKDRNVIEAACSGAMVSAKIIASIIVNVIAFLSLLKFINATLTWFGDRVGVEKLTFQFICSYVLYPVALFMGTETDDCRKVAELVGIKTFTNEFIAYTELSKLIAKRKMVVNYQSNPNNTWFNDGDFIVLGSTRVEKDYLAPRSEVIATYALCGFSNFGSMGILLGSLTTLAPTRRRTMSKLILRAMIAGNIACFFTACIAGLFYEEFD